MPMATLTLTLTPTPHMTLALCDSQTVGDRVSDQCDPVTHLSTPHDPSWAVPSGSPTVCTDRTQPMRPSLSHHMWEEGHEVGLIYK